VGSPIEILVKAESVGTDGFYRRDSHGCDPLKTRAWIDFQNDVPEDVKLLPQTASAPSSTLSAIPPPVWRRTRAKTQTHDASRGRLRFAGCRVPKIGLTTFARPIRDTFAFFAGQSSGDLFDPGAKTAIHDWERKAERSSRKAACGSGPTTSPKGGEDIACGVASGMQGNARVGRIFDRLPRSADRGVGKDPLEFHESPCHQRWTQA